MDITYLEHYLRLGKYLLAKTVLRTEGYKCMFGLRFYDFGHLISMLQ